MSQGWSLQRDAALANTFGIRASAHALLRVQAAEALPDALAQPGFHSPLVLGGGSNVLIAADLERVLTLSCSTVDLLGRQDGLSVVRAEAGMGWHALVMWTLERGLCGLENLALIPGTVGAAPIQNIGAYGVEAGEHVLAVQAWDTQQGRWARLSRQDCGFAYRDSVFKRQPQRWIVAAVEFALPARPQLRLDYAGIGEELAAMGVRTPGPREVAEAVIRIRRRKLPDPAVQGNAGSFFKNPIVAQAQAQALQAHYPALPVFPGIGPDSRKLSAAWLIQTAGWKGFREGDAGVSAQHALVLVNHGQASGAQLLALARRIADSVEECFGVAIEPEPLLLGARW